MPTRTWSLCGALVVALALAAPVQAQDDAPRVDPDSPAGTEYELPLDRARQEAGAGAGSSGDTAEAPLFGEGVEAGSGSKTAASPTNPATDSDPATTGDVEAGGPAEAPAKVRAQVATPEGDAGGVLAVVAGAGGVILLGGLAGLMLRRRSIRG